MLPSKSKTIGLDVGLKEFYTDSNGDSIPNPRFLRKGEDQLKRSQRLVSRKVKGSLNRRKARVILGKQHLKVSRQRKDHGLGVAYALNLSPVYELRIPASSVRRMSNLWWLTDRQVFITGPITPDILHRSPSTAQKSDRAYLQAPRTYRPEVHPDIHSPNSDRETHRLTAHPTWPK